MRLQEINFRSDRFKVENILKMEVLIMKKLSKIIITLLLTATISPTARAAEIPIESAPCN